MVQVDVSVVLFCLRSMDTAILLTGSLYIFQGPFKLTNTMHNIQSDPRTLTNIDAEGERDGKVTLEAYDAR